MKKSQDCILLKSELLRREFAERTSRLLDKGLVSEIEYYKTILPRESAKFCLQMQEIGALCVLPGMYYQIVLEAFPVWAEASPKWGQNL